MAKRVVKKKAVARAECKWCHKMLTLDNDGRIPSHQSNESKKHWPYEYVEPSRCPGSGVDPKDWDPKPVTTQPKKKVKKNGQSGTRRRTKKASKRVGRKGPRKRSR